MIVTVTLNPSVDRTMEIDSLERGRVLRADHTHVDPGGKGVNVSRALIANGSPSRAIVPCGGEEGYQLVRLLREEGVEPVTVGIAGRTRSNITLVEPSGAVTKINEPGPALSDTEWSAVTDAVLGAIDDGDWVVVCGSAPPGVSVARFAGLCARLVESGARLAVDTSGPALRAAAEAGALVVKPNRHELSEAVGVPLRTIADVRDAAETVRGWGARTVLASLGAAGAVLVETDGVLIGEPPAVDARNSVGAGDAMLAGFLSAGATGATALTEALAWGSAAAGLPGSRMPSADHINRRGVSIRPGHPLSIMDG